MKITDITVHTGDARKCTMRDIAEPVSFTVTARLRITISRFKDVPTVSAGRLTEMLKETLAEDGITEESEGADRGFCVPPTTPLL